MRRRPFSTVLCVAAALAGGIFLGRMAWSHRGERVTLTSLSPDDALRVRLVELPNRIDRNFELRLEDLRKPDGGTRTVFRSPDEGRPEGSERIVWSKDGSRFLLLGRHFYVHGNARLPSGESLYLMYEVPSGRVWCNAQQVSGVPSFSLQDVSTISWFGGLGTDPR